MTVLSKTKLIEGVTCIVVNDKVSENGFLVEDTDDWFAQARDGDVYGETSSRAGRATRTRGEG